MALKKSELYSSLWSSCDELRGGMDASQYKDYVLVLLFIKYVSDKYAGVPYAPITIPVGASFKDMVALKGKPDIGDQINKKIIGPLANANKLSDMPDFNEPSKLGSSKEMVERLTNLIAIFENKALDFSKNRAEGDDILGDAYEYLMRLVALYGYGIQVRLDRGHLFLEDGIGLDRRRYRLPRVGHGLRRLVVIGSDGMVSLAALRRLADQDASFVMLERDGSVLATTGPVRPSDAKLRRAQALAHSSGAALRITA
jgi:hypothetical protein